MTQEGKPSSPAAAHAGLIFVPCERVREPRTQRGRLRVEQSRCEQVSAPTTGAACSLDSCACPLARGKACKTVVLCKAHRVHTQATAGCRAHLVVALWIALHVRQVLLGCRTKLSLLLLTVAAPERPVHLRPGRLELARKLDGLWAALCCDPGLLHQQPGLSVAGRSFLQQELPYKWPLRDPAGSRAVMPERGPHRRLDGC